MYFKGSCRQNFLNYYVFLSLKVVLILVKSENPDERQLLRDRTTMLTLKATITTTADDKFCDTFPNFQKLIRYDIS